ncbi:hypothetical protein BJX76DRAFT_332082 [Aspergillus varians]
MNIVIAFFLVFLYCARYSRGSYQVTPPSSTIKYIPLARHNPHVLRLDTGDLRVVDCGCGCVATISTGGVHLLVLQESTPNFRLP